MSYCSSMTEENNNNELFNCLKCQDKNWIKECECDDEECHELIYLRDKKNNIRRFKAGHQNRGKNNGKWKGGRILKLGYWHIHKPYNIHASIDGYVPEHVYVFTEFYKCCMLPWGHIHHIDPVREGYCNNDITNLQGMTISQHMTLHHELRREIAAGRICFICGSNETYVDPNSGVPWWNEVEGKGWRCDKCYHNDPIIRERRRKYWREYDIKRGRKKIKN